MATTTWYTTRDALKLRLGIQPADTADDAKIDSIIPAISRAIDGHCWRSFYVDAADTTRYFTADAGDRLYPGDFVSITTLATDDTGDRTYSYEWAATDYDKEPFNAALYGLPYTSIRATPNGDYLFPTFQKGVKVIGRFGWPSVPDAIAEATLLAAEKLFKRKDAIFGVVGGGGLGELKQMMKDDPELWLLLNPYRKADVQAMGF